MSGATLQLSFSSNSEAADFFAALSNAFRALAATAVASVTPAAAAVPPATAPAYVGRLPAVTDTDLTAPPAPAAEEAPKTRKPRAPRTAPAAPETPVAVSSEPLTLATGGVEVLAPLDVAPAPSTDAPAPARTNAPSQAPQSAPSSTSEVSRATFTATFAKLISQKGPSAALALLTGWSKAFGVPVNRAGKVPDEHLAAAYADVLAQLGE